MRPLVSSIFITLLVTITGFSAYSATNVNDFSLKRHKINIGKLRESIRQHQGKIIKSDQDKKSLLDELEKIDKKIEKIDQRIAESTRLIEQKNENIKKKKEELVAIELNKKKLQQHLVSRLKAYYIRGDNTFFKYTFSRKSLPDLFLFEDAFRTLVAYDKKIFASYRSKKEEIKRVKQHYEYEKAAREAILFQLSEEKKSHAIIAGEKKALLEKTKNQKQLYERALAEMKKAETGLTSTILQLKKKKERLDQGFLRNKGQLPPPVKGTLLFTFRQVTGEKDNILNNGITIKPKNGAEVQAVYNGKVIYASYMKGFGNTVIIDHGYAYYTITARLQRIRCELGDDIQQGQMIGVSGNLATLFGRGLYFEIRHGSEPEDPLKWINTENLL